MSIILEALPVEAVLALSKLADKDSKVCKSARKYIKPGRIYKGRVTVNVAYEVRAVQAGSNPAVPLDAWAILAAILDTPDGLEIVGDGAERAHHYRESQAHVKGLAKDAASETWTFTRPASIRVTVKNEVSDASVSQNLDEIISAQGGAK